MYNNILLLYALLIAPISIAVFLYGFFPTAYYGDAIATREDIPRYVKNVRIQRDILYRPMVRKLVIMVIDALRWDFVASTATRITMPATSNLLQKYGCLLRAKLQSPTVTMPRIKAMMTGMVPNFVDIVLNFWSDPLASDNLLFQAKKHGHTLIFYGDDTWLALFPNIFKRQDGTVSFFVSDFIEVDNNVTRHIQDELNNDDWSMMILHYLGLDHIGHVEGPFGTSIKSKLKEMDEVIAQIARKVQYWNDNDTPTLFVICGDHGMRDSGGHGGSTPQETTVPLIVLGGTHCSYQETGEPIEIEQLDLAPTLSVALGLPIPSTNLGSVFLDSVYKLADSKRLFLLYYNSRQISDHFRKLVNHKLQQDIYRRYSEVLTMHVTWLNTTEKPSEMAENIILSYNAILRDMRSALIETMIKYDIHLISAAMLCLCHILCILFIVQNPVWTTHKRIAFFFLLNVGLWLGISYFVNTESTTLSYSTNIFNISLIALIIGILYLNCYFLASMKCNDLSVMMTKETKTRVLHIGALLHIISFAGSSFIEEEHQTWYFFWTSLVTYLLYHCFRKFFACHQQNEVRFEQLLLSANLIAIFNIMSIKVQIGMNPSYSDSTHPFRIEICIKLLLLLTGHRILQKLNSTGDKYAHLPDIAGWLREDDSKAGITILLLIAIILLIWIAHESEDTEYKQRSLILNIAIAVCIYLRHASNGAVAKIPLYPMSSGIYEVQIFWGMTLLFLVNCSYRIRLIITRNRKRFTNIMLFFIINIWVMTSAMLHQPYNVILLPMHIIASSIIDTTLRANNFVELGVFVQCWLGNVFYFYQGNSNSLASVDIAAGYVGLRSYVSFVTGVYLIINTYSAPILAYFLFVYYQQLNRANCNSSIWTSRIYIAWRLLTMTVYTIIITIQRHHLFVWSVFSPKLLYEAMFSVIMCCSVLLLLVITMLQGTMNSV